MAMILFPGVQTKAHEELDTVLGKGVLPTFDDRERLPYLQAVIYELFRWHAVFPLGLYIFPFFAKCSEPTYKVSLT